MNTKKTLWQSWTCTRCGQRNFEDTDMRTCLDTLSCEIRERRNMRDRTDTFIETESKYLN